MDERLIRESDVIKLIDEWLDNYPLPRHVEKGLMSHEELLAYIEEAPTIEAKPIVHAHWEEHREFYEDEGFEGYYYSCSNCGGTLYGDVEGFNFCHCCGAQMDEVVSDTNVGSKMNGSEKPNSWVVIEENATTTNNTQKVSVDGVKIPVISMEEVPKIMEKIK